MKINVSFSLDRIESYCGLYWDIVGCGHAAHHLSWGNLVEVALHYICDILLVHFPLRPLTALGAHKTLRLYRTATIT